MRWFNVIVVTLCGFFMTVPTLSSDSLEAPAARTNPASAMYTLEDIYNRLNNGTVGNKRTGGFARPTSGPAAAGYTLNEIMSVSPVADNANGATPKDVLSGKTFWGVRTDGTWGGQLGTGGGRFTDNGNGTVTDNKTDLIWLKNANCFGTKTWDSALAAASGLTSGSCGLTDGSVSGAWRLPTIGELESLVDRNFYSPALSNAAGTAKWTEGGAFSGVQTDYYWSSTTYADSTSNAWFVSLYNGSVNRHGKTYDLYVWPVRGGQ